MERIVVVVTGANSGIGFGICHRLLRQLSCRHPPDAAPFHLNNDGQIQKNNARKTSSGGVGDSPNGYTNNNNTKECHDGNGELGRDDARRELKHAPPRRLTIVMACRSTHRAEVARTQLLRLLDADIDAHNNGRGNKVEREHGYDDDDEGEDGYAEMFRKNLEIDVMPLDLAVMQSIFRFGDALKQKYPYISHLICNAGIASFTTINLWSFAKEFFNDPVKALTSPDFYGQNVGELSVDGLGWIWQCNVFGHYTLFRAIEPLLSASPSSDIGPRVIWMSSLTAFANYYDKHDWQLIKSEHSYQASKYQMELIATQLERVSLASRRPQGPPRIMHLIVDPGVTNTNFSAKLLNFFTSIIQILLFYFVRLLGSPHHTITSYQAAVSAVQLSLMPLYLINSFRPLEGDRLDRQDSLKVPTPNEPEFHPRRFCAITDWSGRESVRVSGVSEWQKNQELAASLLDQFEEFYGYWKDGASKDNKGASNGF